MSWDVTTETERRASAWKYIDKLIKKKSSIQNEFSFLLSTNETIYTKGIYTPFNFLKNRNFIYKFWKQNLLD